MPLPFAQSYLRTPNRTNSYSVKPTCSCGTAPCFQRVHRVSPSGSALRRHPAAPKSKIHKGGRARRTWHQGCSMPVCVLCCQVETNVSGTKEVLPPGHSVKRSSPSQGDKHELETRHDTDSCGVDGLVCDRVCRHHEDRLWRNALRLRPSE